MTRNRHRFVDTALNAVKSLSRLPDGKIVAKGDFTFVRNGSRVLVLWRPFERFQGIRKELDIAPSFTAFVHNLRNPLRLARIFAVLEINDANVEVIECAGSMRSLSFFNSRRHTRVLHLNLVKFKSGGENYAVEH